jgi:hypothetical protein
LTRTQNPKYTTYNGDGTGRDSYAIVGNGGLINPSAFRNVAPRTGVQQKYIGSAFSNKAPCAPLVGKKNTTAIRYWGTGQGREQYIIVNSGGGIPQYNTKNSLSRYYDSLRSYN